MAAFEVLGVNGHLLSEYTPDAEGRKRGIRGE